MNATINPKLENKIVAYIDGELSSDDSADLSRLILKDPEARALLDEYQQNDAMANAAIEALMQAANPVQPNNTSIAAAPSTMKTFRWYGPVAAAASIAIMTLGAFFVMPTMMGALGIRDLPGTEVAEAGPHRHGGAPMIENDPALEEARAIVAEFRPDGAVKQDVVFTADELDYGPQLNTESDSVKNTERSFFGLFDERDQRFYWLEVQHTEDDYQIIELDL